MARNTKWSDDLAALAEGERQRLGEPPDLEQLIAFRDGKLPEEEAEQVLDRLAIDPELAAVYLELKRGVALEASSADIVGDEISDADVDDAWRQLSPRLDGDASLTAEPVDGAAEAAFFPRRGWGWGGTVALAATLALAVGLSWQFANREFLAPTPTPLPVGAYLPVSDEEYRDSRVQVPAEVVGLALHIDVSELVPGPVRFELLDALDEIVRWQPVTIEAGQQEVIFRVASSSLVEGRSYQVVVRSAEASPGIQMMTFQPTFERDTSESPSSSTAGDATTAVVVCIDLDADLSRAIALRIEGQRQPAETIYMEVLARASARGCSLQEARAANGLGVLAIQRWQPYKSLVHLDEAATALAALKGTAAFNEDASKLERTLEFNRGTSYSRLGWLEDAHDAFDRVRTLDRRLGGELERRANLLLQLVRIHRLQGEPQEAQEALREAFDLLELHEGETQPLRASLWQEQARLDIEAGRFDVATQNLDHAIEALAEFEDRFAKANVFADVGELEVREGRWAEGLRWVGEALDLAAGEKPDFNLEIHARYVQSMALEGLGDLVGAKRAADSGLALLESLREVWRDQGLRFFALRQIYYRHRLDLAKVAEGPDDAWGVFEDFRARGLLESVSMRSRQPSDGAEPPDEEEIEQKRRDLLEAVRQLDLLDPVAPEEIRVRREAVFRARLRELRELQTEQARSAGLKLPPAVVDPPAALAMLEGGTLGLVFAMGRERVHVLVLDPRIGLEGMTLGVSRQELEELIRRFIEGSGPDARTDARRQLDDSTRDLSRALLGIVFERLGNVQRLVIVADGRLEGLPFGTLRHPQTGRRLIESHEIAYLPSFSVLGALRARAGECASPVSDLLAVGDPVFGSRDRRWPRGAPDSRTADEALALRRLLATEDEVQSIAGLYSKGKVVLGPEANRDLFLAEAPLHRVIHVASHASSDREVPERSKIALSCIDAGDNVLETCDFFFEDVVALDLCGRTVVLSACETAGGPAVAGEGILGLPRAFLRAGASTVVASLWRVADDQTSELMVAFHRHLQSGEGPAAALQKAKLELIASGRPLSAWAAFVVLGDW